MKALGISVRSSGTFPDLKKRDPGHRESATNAPLRLRSVQLRTGLDVRKNTPPRRRE